MKRLHVIGTSADTGLSEAAKSALEQAELIIGSSHQFDCVAQEIEHSQAKRMDYPTPLDQLKQLIDENQDMPIAILASGDPLYYGIGAWLGRNFSCDQLVFHPNTSSIQSAFARIGLPWQDAEVISLHGRPLASLRARLRNQQLFALLTDKRSTPQSIAKELFNHGYQQSTLWVCEDLGGANERVQQLDIETLCSEQQFSQSAPPQNHSSQAIRFHPLNVVIVKTAGSAPKLPEFPGIEDHLFDTDGEAGQGMLSKREVRLNILSLLQPTANQVCWDVGAGCGGVSVEWARWNPQGQIHSIECHPERLTHLAANRERFGVVKNLNIVEQKAPEAFAELPDPDSIFVGGSSGPYCDILAQSWQRLKPGGKMVCTAVTENTRHHLFSFADSISAEQPATEWLEIAVSKGDSLAGRLLLRPQLPVLLVSFTKAAGAE